MRRNAIHVLGFVGVVIVGYLIVGGVSLLAIGLGEDISYSTFWHAPWRLLFNLLR